VSGLTGMHCGCRATVHVYPCRDCCCWRPSMVYLESFT